MLLEEPIKQMNLRLLFWLTETFIINQERKEPIRDINPFLNFWWMRSYNRMGFILQDVRPVFGYMQNCQPLSQFWFAGFVLPSLITTGNSAFLQVYFSCKHEDCRQYYLTAGSHHINYPDSCIHVTSLSNL